ncbi:hypothetical protein [Vallitalea okinawensis]|uniref:hypothetical protein n=1 Tax=Vallitalea okinawensis TaxID=2078660 RepID=UPI000CFDFA33|nr:hypothetical protein [Vallitalea okinawensis]
MKMKKLALVLGCAMLMTVTVSAHEANELREQDQISIVQRIRDNDRNLLRWFALADGEHDDFERGQLREKIAYYKENPDELQVLVDERIEEAIEEGKITEEMVEQVKHYRANPEEWEAVKDAKLQEKIEEAIEEGKITEEMVEKVQYYRANPEEWDAVKEAKMEEKIDEAIAEGKITEERVEKIKERRENRQERRADIREMIKR